MEMKARLLSGMEYFSVEVRHRVSLPMSDVLYGLADWLDDNGHVQGILTSITTQNDLDDEDKFLTTLVWA